MVAMTIVVMMTKMMLISLVPVVAAAVLRCVNEKNSSSDHSESLCAGMGWACRCCCALHDCDEVALPSHPTAYPRDATSSITSIDNSERPFMHHQWCHNMYAPCSEQT